MIRPTVPTKSLARAVCLGLLLVAALPARATTGYWTNNNTANWDLGTSWLDGIVPNHAGDVAYFTHDFTAARAVNIVGSVTNGMIYVGDADGSHVFSISGSGGTNVFDNAGGGAALTMTETSSNLTVNTGLVLLKDNLAITNRSDASLMIISSVMQGPGALAVAGGPGVLLSGSNNFSGGITVNSGVLRFGHNYAMGTGPMTFKGGVVDVLSTRTTLNNNDQTWSGDFTFLGSATWNMGAGAITLAGNQTLTVAASTLTVPGPIGDGASTYSLTKAGPGVLALIGTNTFGGGIILNEGELAVNGPYALGLGTLVINGGILNDSTSTAVSNANVNAQLWNGNFTYPARSSLHLGAGNVTLNGNITITNPYSIYGSFLTVGGTIDDGASSYSLTFGGVNGGLALAGANTYDGGTILTGGKLYINHPQALGSGPLTIYGGQIDNYSGATVSNENNNIQYWNGDFSFYGHSTLHLGTGAVTLGSSIIVSNINNLMSVHGPIEDGANTYSLTKRGNGTLALAGENTLDGGITIDSGALQLDHPKALGSGLFTINGGSLSSTMTAGYSNANNNAQVWNGDFTLVGGRSVHLGTGPVTLNRSCAIETLYAGLTVGGVIDDGGHGYGLTKARANTLTLTGVNTYRGDTLVSTGTLALVGAGSIENSATINVVTPGILSVFGRTDRSLAVWAGQTLAGSGAVSGQVTLVGGKLSPGYGVPGALVPSSLVITGGLIRIEMTDAASSAGAGWDVVKLLNAGTGALELSGAGSGSITIQVASVLADLPGFSQSTDGSWLILDGGSVAGFSAAKFVVDESLFTPGGEGGVWAVSTTGGDLYLNYTAPTTPIDLAVSILARTNGVATSVVPVGDAVTYAITLTNQSPDTAQRYYVTNRLAAGLTYLSCSDGGSQSGGVVSWTLSNLAAGGSRTVTVTAMSTLQGTFASTATVLPRRDEETPADNQAASEIFFYCPNAGVVPNNAPTSVTATNGHSLTFTVTATNDDCNAPYLVGVGLPAGASFDVTTNGYGAVGTFSWPVPTTGAYPVRFYSYNQTKATSTVVTIIYVSTTNWPVLITNLLVSSSGNATVVWQSVDGITYDIYSSTMPIDGGASWSKVVSGQEASGSLSTSAVTSAGSMYFYQVVPEGSSPMNRDVWGVVRMPITSGIALQSPPLVGDRRFDGALGTNLAAAVPAGSKVHIMTDPTPNWQTLQLTGGGQWLTSPGGAVYSTPLGDGQAYFIEGASGTTPVFKGPVGNDGSSSQALEVGFNLISVSEGKGLSVTTAFNSANPVGHSDEALADQIILQNSNGSWRRLVRLSTGVWYDMSTPGTASVTLMPGQAYYYIRRDTDATVSF